MSTQILTFTQFADLLQTEAQRGIINGQMLLQFIQDNKLPKIIHDIRGAVRLTVERAGEDLEVTRYVTALAEEKILEPR